MKLLFSVYVPGNFRGAVKLPQYFIFGFLREAWNRKAATAAPPALWGDPPGNKPMAR